MQGLCAGRKKGRAPEGPTRSVASALRLDAHPFGYLLYRLDALFEGERRKHIVQPIAFVHVAPIVLRLLPSVCWKLWLGRTI